THANFAAKVRSLVTAWEWRPDDWILLVLPLHHVHGIINVVTCALWAGARCEMLAKFDAEPVWSRIAARELTLFMAVPTIYGKLIGAWESAPPERRRAWSAGCASPPMRLMVSGSAALPVQRLERWREISGHVLLERYGMSEVGLALCNPLSGGRGAGLRRWCARIGRSPSAPWSASQTPNGGSASVWRWNHGGGAGTSRS